MPEQILPFKVRKLPVEVEAMPTTGITGATLEDVASWCGGHVIAGHTGQPDRQTGIAILVPTLEGDMVANFGDWIVKGVEGEFHPVRGAIFAKTYEMVEGPAGKEPGTVTVAGLDFPVESVAQAVADAIGLEDLNVRLPDGSGDTEWEGCGAEASGSRVLFDCVVPMATDDGEDYEERVTLALLVESVRPSDVDAS